MGKKIKKTNAIRTLERLGLAYDLQPYHYNPEDLDVQRIAEENQLPLEQIYKTLVLKGEQTGVLVALVDGTQDLNLKKLAQASGNKKVALLPTKDLQAVTGYIRGGCSPIGMKKQFPIYMSALALECPKIYLNAGVRGLLLGVAPQSLVEPLSITCIDLI